MYGQHKNLGKYLLERVVDRKAGSRSTQNVPIENLIKKYGFDVVCPPDKTKEFVLSILINYQRNLVEHLDLSNIKTIQDVNDSYR